jgi:predicted transposase YbfD/YdcC
MNLQTVAMIRSIRQEGENTSTQDSYYISSLECDAQRILEAKRSHWAIENSLHWLLDVTFDEDRHQQQGDGAANMAVVRHIALNLLKQDNTPRLSIKRKRLKAAWSTEYLEKILRQG